MRPVLLSIVAAAAAALAATADAACTLAKVAEVPVTMEGLRPTVTGKINGREAKFVLDTGAFFSSMTRASATAYGLKIGPPPFGMSEIRGVGGKSAQIDVATVKSFELAGRTLANVDFIVLPGGAEAGEVGLIGQNLLETTDVEYDFADGVVRRFAAKDCGYAPLAYWDSNAPYSEMSIAPVTPLTPQIVGEVTLNGVRIKAGFDSGSPMSILSTRAAALAGVTPSTPGVTPAGDVSGLGRNSYLAAWRGTFASLKVGDEELKNFRLMFGDINLGGVDMLIGADFFLSHRMLVANSQHRLYFTYNGGPVFNVGGPHPPAVVSAGQPRGADGAPASPSSAGVVAKQTPRTADEFARQAAALMATRDFAGAAVDWTDALALSPNEPHYVYERALSELGEHNAKAALADLDQAVKLDPSNLDPLLARAEVRFADHAVEQAKADVDAAAALAEKQPDQRLAVAEAYESIKRDKDALAELDAWLAGHPLDDRRATALNERCWLNTLLDADLKQALADCNEALSIRPGDPAYLDSRALAELRSGDLDHALTDYNAALRVRPGTAWSLYGRGLAKLRKGMSAAGQADIAAAEATDPTLAGEARSYGLTP